MLLLHRLLMMMLKLKRKSHVGKIMLECFVNVFYNGVSLPQKATTMLTKKQAQVYEYIKDFIGDKGYSPSCHDIASHLGTSSRGSVLKHVNALIKHAFITKTPHVARGIQLTPVARESHSGSIPHLGKIAAGSPLLAFDHIEQIDLNHHLSQGNKCYLLSVEGESMIGIGIQHNDLVLIRAQQTADNGQIVVALIDDYETTLKRYHLSPDDTITLSPENRHMSPLVFPVSRVKLQGVLVAHIRQYH